MSEQYLDVQNPAKSAAFKKEAIYKIGKTEITVESIFRKQGLNINQILSRLIRADIEGK